jgi:hypothetical protein
MGIDKHPKGYNLEAVMEIDRVAEILSRIRRWYPLPVQRQNPLVQQLADHMIDCIPCAEAAGSACSMATTIIVEADNVLGLREP